MGGSGRKTLMSLAGVYLVYVGGKLFLDAMRDKPGNYIFMMIMGIIFVIFGIGTVVIYMRGAFKHEKIEEETDEMGDVTDETADLPADQATDESADARKPQERKQAAFINFTDLKGTEPKISTDQETMDHNQDKEKVDQDTEDKEKANQGIEEAVRDTEETEPCTEDMDKEIDEEAAESGWSGDVEMTNEEPDEFREETSAFPEREDENKEKSE